MSDVIVTGLPRSGLTVVAALIDGLPNAICFNMPLSHIRMLPRMAGATEFCKYLVGDFFWTRAQLTRGHIFKDFRADDGMPLMDNLKDPRRKLLDNGNTAAVSFTRSDLEGDFILAMKHHALYTVILPKLVRFNHFKIIAVIRHPFDVITSWQKLDDDTIAEGKLPYVKKIWPEAARISFSTTTSLLDRMVQLYDLQIQRYHELREHIHIVKYEDVLEDPRCVSEIFGMDFVSASATMMERRRRILITENIAQIRISLEKYGVFTRMYYDKL